MTDRAKGGWVKAPNDDVLETHPHLIEFLPFLDALNLESARGGVLIAASFLENLLTDILRAYLLDGQSSDQLLTGFNAPIGTFSAKVALSSSLSLITEAERRECNLIRKIRNRFAHNIHPSFDDAAIASLCFELEYRAKPYEGVSVDARASFTTASVGLISSLTNRAHYVAQERVKARNWSN